MYCALKSSGPSRGGFCHGHKHGHQFCAGTTVATSHVHQKSVDCLSYSPDGAVLLASSEDWPAALCTPDLDTQLGQLTIHQNAVIVARWCGNLLATTDSTELVHLHSVDFEDDKLKVQHRMAWTGHSDQVTTINWAPNQWMLASCSEDKSVQLWSTHQVCL
jgi:WD40 repeat protein